MLYSEKLKTFSAAHPCEEVTVDGARFRYILCGSAGGKTLVFLNGGMNTLEMWMDYAGALSGDCRVLLFDYPRELRTNQALVTGMHAFFRKLGIEAPMRSHTRRICSRRSLRITSRKRMCISRVCSPIL